MPDGLGILGGYNAEYDAATRQQGDIARYRGLQALSQMMGPQMGVPPGMLPQGPQANPPMPPQGGPPMGGPPMGGQPPPPGGPPMGGPAGLSPMLSGGAMGGVPGQPVQPQRMPPPGGPPGMPPGGGGMPPGMQPPGGQQQGGGFQTPGQGPLSLPMVIQVIQKANPGAPPNVLAAAIDGMIPLMNMQSQQQWREQRMLMQEAANQRQWASLDERERHDVATETEAGKRTEQAQERIQQGEEKIKQGEEKIKQGDRRIRLAEARLEWQKDKGLQDLDIKRQALEERIKSGKDKTAITQWRTIIDAQHKRMTEIIQSSNIMSKLTDDERKEIRKEADQMRDQAIKGIRGATGSSTPTGGTTTTPGPKVEGGAPQSTPPGQIPTVSAGGEAVPLPPALSKEEDGTIFEKDGKRFMKQGNQLIPAQ